VKNKLALFSKLTVFRVPIGMFLHTTFCQYLVLLMLMISMFYRFVYFVTSTFCSTCISIGLRFVSTKGRDK
jgi:hypothetical protein